MGFWLLVGTLLRGETNPSRTCYRWWINWIPNWLDGCKRGVLDTCSTTEKEGWVVYQDYRPGAIVYHFTNPVVGTNIKLHTLAHKNRSHGMILATSYRARKIDGHYRHQRWSGWPTCMSALSGVLFKPCFHIFIGFSFLSYDVTNV